mmetsp:Transcript_16871/g.27374  ORF Transcript_16871/g.27374 Transcript_16871/m.27374 type:complete len:668 (-) Transcript_16871:261-2264(-)
MTLDTHFKRDSPPGSVLEGEVLLPQRAGKKGGFFSNRDEDSCEEQKDRSSKKRTVSDRRFSSKQELDAGLLSMFQPVDESNRKNLDCVLEDTPEHKDHGREELELVKHLTEPTRGNRSKASDSTPEAKKPKKKGRKKRGASLERMIAKLIIQQTSKSEHNEKLSTITVTETSSSVKLSAKDILSDLVKSSDGSASHMSGQSKETSPWTNATRGSTTKTSSTDAIPEEEPRHVSHQQAVNKTTTARDQSKPERSSVFDFSLEDEWTAFDDCPPFDKSLFPSQVLDKNGFPVVVEETTAKTDDTIDEDENSNASDIDEDDLSAEEEQMAAELSKEMAAEVERERALEIAEALARKKTEELRLLEESQEYARKMAEGNKTKVSGSEVSRKETIEKVGMIETERKRDWALQAGNQRWKEARLERDGENEDPADRLAKERALTERRAEEKDRREQEMAKELARRIAKEQEWKKLQEMALELARKKMGQEKSDVFEKESEEKPLTSRREIKARYPVTLESVEVAQRGELDDDDISSLPTYYSGDSKAQSQTQTKENHIPSQSVDRAETIEPSVAIPGKKDANHGQSGRSRPCIDPPENSSDTSGPRSPSSVTDLHHQTMDINGHNGLTVSPRYRRARVVFGNRQAETTTPHSRPKPTWNPKPPKHYNRTSNHL